MSLDQNKVFRSSNPCVTAETQMLAIAASAAGVADVIETELRAQGVNVGRIAGIRVTNPTAGGALIYVRDSALAGAAVGEEIPIGGERYYPWAEGGSTLGIENPHTIYLTIFYA